MSEKKTIHFSKEDLDNIAELSRLLNYTDIYGEIPKVLKFSITFTLKTMAAYEKVIPYDLTSEMPLVLSSIEKLRKDKEKAALLDKIAKS